MAQKELITKQTHILYLFKVLPTIQTFLHSSFLKQ